MAEEVKLSFEQGTFEWPGGRYESPSPRPGGGAPDAVDTQADLVFVPTSPLPNPNLELRPARVRTFDQPESFPSVPDHMTARELLGVGDDPRELDEMLAREVQEAVGHMIPNERINLDNGTAVFRGHEITLASDALNAILAVLATEVCRVLDEEQKRVLESVGIPLQNQPAEPEPPQPLGETQAS